MIYWNGLFKSISAIALLIYIQHQTISNGLWLAIDSANILYNIDQILFDGFRFGSRDKSKLKWRAYKNETMLLKSIYRKASIYIRC